MTEIPEFTKLQMVWRNVNVSMWYIYVRYLCGLKFDWSDSESALKVCCSFWYWSKKAWSKAGCGCRRARFNLFQQLQRQAVCKSCSNNLKQNIMQILVFLQTIDQMINVNIMSVCKVRALLPALIPEILTQFKFTCPNHYFHLLDHRFTFHLSVTQNLWFLQQIIQIVIEIQFVTKIILGYLEERDTYT